MASGRGASGTVESGKEASDTVARGKEASGTVARGKEASGKEASGMEASGSNLGDEEEKTRTAISALVSLRATSNTPPTPNYASLFADLPVCGRCGGRAPQGFVGDKMVLINEFGLAEYEPNLTNQRRLDVLEDVLSHVEVGVGDMQKIKPKFRAFLGIKHPFTSTPAYLPLPLNVDEERELVSRLKSTCSIQIFGRTDKKTDNIKWLSSTLNDMGFRCHRIPESMRTGSEAVVLKFDPALWNNFGFRLEQGGKNAGGRPRLNFKFADEKMYSVVNDLHAALANGVCMQECSDTFRRSIVKLVHMGVTSVQGLAKYSVDDLVSKFGFEEATVVGFKNTESKFGK